MDELKIPLYAILRNNASGIGCEVLMHFDTLEKAKKNMQDHNYIKIAETHSREYNLIHWFVL